MNLPSPAPHHVTLYERPNIYRFDLIYRVMEKKDQFKQIIREFHERKLPEVYRRELEIPETKKIVSLIGSRRSGKTFFFYQLINDLKKEIDVSQATYINFEDDRILPLELKDLNLLLEAYFELYPENAEKTVYFFFDEIQNIEDWEVFVRRIHDTLDARIFVTGSSSKLLSKEIATSLRGRTLPFYLYPLSFREFLSFRGVEAGKDTEYSSRRHLVRKLFGEYMLWGGFPEIALEDESLRQMILNNYYEMFIYRDLVERYSIRNINLLKNVARYLLTNISAPFSRRAYYNVLKENMALGKDTLGEYISCLEDINLVYLVPIFNYSLKSQQVNPRKIYCIDTGLRSAVTFRFSGDFGKIAENIVFIELKRRGYEIFYWKDHREVDFVIKDGAGKLTAINVSYTNSIEKREIDGLKEFSGKYDADLILLTKDIGKEENNISFIPLWKWLLDS